MYMGFETGELCSFDSQIAREWIERDLGMYRASQMFDRSLDSGPIE